MTMYVRIDHNSKYTKKKVRRKIPLGYIPLVDNKCKKKANVVSLVTKREKCFDRWEAGSVEIN